MTTNSPSPFITSSNTSGFYISNSATTATLSANTTGPIIGTGFSDTNVITLIDSNHDFNDLISSMFGDSVLHENGKKLLKAEGRGRIKFADDAILEIDDQGQWKLFDENQHVLYRGGPREFNKYVNASDLLEEFIGDCGKVHVQQDEILKLPLGLFVHWLIIKAAEQDDDPMSAEGVPRLEQDVKKLSPRCSGCGQFINKNRAKAGLFICSSACFEKVEQSLN